MDVSAKCVPFIYFSSSRSSEMNCLEGNTDGYTLKSGQVRSRSKCSKSQCYKHNNKKREINIFKHLSNSIQVGCRRAVGYQMEYAAPLLAEHAERWVAQTEHAVPGHALSQNERLRFLEKGNAQRKGI